MTKSERVNLIQKIAGALSQNTPPTGDLMLHQFGFHTEREWEADREDYYISMLQSGNDKALQELATYLNLHSATLPTDPDADRRLWGPGFCRCFLSHTSKHKTVAASLKASLEAYGCDVFVAHEDIEPTLDWLREIEAALRSSHCLLALVTKDFHGSLWTDQEVGFVLGRGLPVVPMRAGKDPYGLMGKLQAVPFNEAALDEAADTIFTALNAKNQTAQHVASGAVQAFLDSPQFVDARKRMGIVERLTALTPELRQRLSEAVSTNNQIAYSFGVPARLDCLLRKAD